MSEFTTDPRIAADSTLLIPLGLSDLRLMNDARYPWLLLVPRVRRPKSWTSLPTTVGTSRGDRRGRGGAPPGNPM